MAKLNIGTKITGDPNNPLPNTTLSADELNTITPSVNALYDGLDASIANITNLQTQVSMELWSKIFKEGRQYASGFRVLPSAYAFDGTVTPEANGASPGTPGSPQPISGFIPTITKVFVLEDLTAQCSADTNVELTFGPTQGGFKGVVGPTQPVNLKGPYWIKPGRIFTGNLFGLVRPTVPAGNKVLFTTSFRGHIISADMNYSANKSIMILGDSNFEGSAIGLTRVSDSAPATRYDVVTWMLRDWYRKNGSDVRLIDFSTAGWSSVDFETLRINGDLDVDDPALIIYNLGTNDTNATTHNTNITKFLAWALGRYPKSKIMFLGPIPKQGGAGGTGNETLLNTIRGNMATLVANANNPNVIFINTGLAWSVNDNTQYSAFDTTTDGNHIHASTTGHISWFNYITNDITNIHTSFLKV